MSPSRAQPSLTQVSRTAQMSPDHKEILDLLPVSYWQVGEPPERVWWPFHLWNEDMHFCHPALSFHITHPFLPCAYRACRKPCCIFVLAGMW